MNLDDELRLLGDADARALAYLAAMGDRPVFPPQTALDGLAAFDEPLPLLGLGAEDTVRMLDEVGSPAAIETNGGRYFGFVVGASLPAAAAAERLLLGWDNGAAAAIAAPAAAAVEDVASRWLLEILELPPESAVGFITSASTGNLIALTTARRTLLARLGWDVDRLGLTGAPAIRVVMTDTAHISVIKALRVLGFGLDGVVHAPVDPTGRVDPDRFPPVDDHTIVILQAGEVNTGEFDPFADLIPAASATGAWVHVDGAFGLWARASGHRALTDGVELADSWVVDGHKWLNTPYDSAMVITRDPATLIGAMQSDSPYAPTSPSAQKNLTLDFSRRARGVPVWAALRSLGRDGVADLIDRTVALAARTAAGLERAGYDVLNRVVLNQVLFTTSDPARIAAVVRQAQTSGSTWFGTTSWQGRPAARISISSWRTTEREVDHLIDLLGRLVPHG